VLETALVLPILLALSFGVVEFGHFLYVKHNVQAAAREGARAAIIPGATAATVSTAVQQAMQAGGLSSSGYAAAVTDVNGNAVNVANVAVGTPVRVRVTCSWGTVGVRPLGLIAANKSVVGTTVMRKEG
jgi:Flp pilus assembly protein TadG